VQLFLNRHSTVSVLRAPARANRLDVAQVKFDDPKQNDFSCSPLLLLDLAGVQR
jgi:ubiquitin